MPATMDEWLTLFKSIPDATIPQLAEVILSNIDGYGIEYGFEVKDDASDLLAAFRALNIWIFNSLKDKVPPEMKADAERAVNKLITEIDKA